MTDEVIFVVSDISIHVFLLYKDWAFDVCKDERVAVFLDAHPLSSMVEMCIRDSLKSTGLHVNGEFVDVPSNEGIMPLWDACEEFLKSTTFKPRKISELIKKLSAKPYKLDVYKRQSNRIVNPKYG